MLRLLKNLPILMLMFLPLYIGIRFLRWSLKSLEKEMSGLEPESHHNKL